MPLADGLRGVSSVARHITGNASHDFLSSFTAQNALHRLLHFKCDLANMEQAKSKLLSRFLPPSVFCLIWRFYCNGFPNYCQERRWEIE
nr:MAG TPA: hypothetical protein [Caudoviricetes sp.]